MARVAMGGTFDRLHRGHVALLAAAHAAGDRGVFCGITTDRFASGGRERSVRPFAEREADLHRLLESTGWGDRIETGPIDDPIGRALEPAFDTLVLTRETLRGADRINAARAEAGLPPLAVVLAPIVLAEDGLRLSATRIVRGEVDRDGRIVERLRVAVGSVNEAKLAAVRAVAGRLHKDCDVRGFPVASAVSEQPVGEAMWRGAAARAASALAEWPEAHVSVGIEAGLVEGPLGRYDVQACVVLDRGDRATSGHGAGFVHPPAVDDAVRHGRTVGEAIAELAADPEAPRREGAVGFLSWGLLDRAALTEQAVMAAWIPRLRPGLYGIDTQE